MLLAVASVLLAALANAQTPAAPTPTPTLAPAAAAAGASAAASVSVSVSVPTSAATAAATPAPTSTPTPTPTPTPTTPPYPVGQWVFGNWKAWYIGTSTELIVVRDTAKTQAISSIDAPFVEPSVLRRYLTFAYGDFMQFGAQPTIERAIDEACKMYKAKPALMPVRKIEEVAREFLGEYGADSMLKHPDKNTPYFVGAVLSSMLKPEKLEKAIAPATFQIVAAVASCKETAGKRYALAQKRGFNTQVSNNVRALTWLIEKWIVSQIEAATSEAAKDQLRGRSIGTSIKAIRLTLAKMSEYQAWLQGAEGKQLGGGAIWDAPLGPRAQEYARGLIQLLETQLASLQKEYAKGTERNPTSFPPIEEADTLKDEDLTPFLSP